MKEATGDSEADADVQAQADADLDRVFHALADRTRRAILRRLAKGEHRVTDLAAPFAMSLNAVSKHLKVLERAGLLRRTVDGRVHRCRMDTRPLERVHEVVSFYRTFWEAHMDALARALDDLGPEPKPKPKRQDEGDPRRASLFRASRASP